ncbi:MAG: fluoride efflux transporter FluC [Verrucomicrobiota bacterium]
MGLGSAAGGMARFGLQLWADRVFPGGFPVGTVLANLTGCFAMGLLAGCQRDGAPLLGVRERQFLLTGVLGGYTTFSAFSLQSLELVQAGRTGWAAIHVGGSVAGCLLAVAAGQGLAHWLTR